MRFSQQLYMHARILGNTVKWTHLFAKLIKTKRQKAKLKKWNTPEPMLKMWWFVSFCLDYIIEIGMCILPMHMSSFLLNSAIYWVSIAEKGNKDGQRNGATLGE